MYSCNPLKSLLTILTICIGLSACQTPLVFTPINASKAGSIAEQTVHLKRKTILVAYLVLMDFQGHDRSKPETWLEVDKLNAIADDITGGSSTPIQWHQGIPLLFKVYKLDKDGGKSQIYQESVYEEKARARSDLTVGGLEVDKGDYVFSIQTLNDDHRLDGVNAALSVFTLGQN